MKKLISELVHYQTFWTILWIVLFVYLLMCYLDVLEENRLLRAKHLEVFDRGIGND
jgi:hypothetical protein